LVGIMTAAIVVTASLAHLSQGTMPRHFAQRATRRVSMVEQVLFFMLCSSSLDFWHVSLAVVEFGISVTALRAGTS
jgi:hypothetical protein